MQRLSSQAYGYFIWTMLLLAGAVRGQHGPALVNYTVAQYNAHNQNWSVTQSEDHTIHSANTDGLLSFNGNEWQLNRLPSGKIVRSVCAAGDRIYVGAYAEIGYWQKDKCGNYKYTELTPAVSAAWIEKEEIWNIVRSGKNIYFQSFSLLLKYDGNRLEKVGLPGSIMFLHQVDSRLLIQSLSFGIYEIFNDDHIELLKGTEFFADKIVTGITPMPGKMKQALLITTSRHGVFSFSDHKASHWHPEMTGYFVDVQINHSLLTKGGLLVLGTIRDGVLLFSADGQLQHHFHTANGLQNNTVISMYEDLDGQLWLGLDRGISVVRIHDSTQYYSDVAGTLGTVYTMAMHENQLYVGTNQGLYKSVAGSYFSLVKGTQGQVWQLFHVDDQLLCGHNEGTFSIIGGNASRISPVTGGWFFGGIPGRSDVLLQGTYTGLAVFRKRVGKWVFSHKVEGYTQPIKKLICQKPGQVWVAGPNTGVALLTLDATFTQVLKVRDFSGQQGGLPQHLNADLAEFEGQIAVYDGTTYFTFDTTELKFREFSWLNEGNADFLIRKIHGAHQNDWFKVFADSIVWMKGRTRFQLIPLKGNRDYHGIARLADSQVGFSLNEGYAVLDLAHPEWSAKERPLQWSRVISSTTGSCIPLDDSRSLELPFEENSLKIYFYDALFTFGKSYKYRIKPGSDNWKTCTSGGYTELTNLSPGSYEIEVLRMGSNTPTTLYLTILPPWYLSSWAILIYLVAIGSLAFWMIRLFNRRLMREKQRLELENDRILREHKIRMENDRLVQDNLMKSRELANATMHLVQKNTLLQDIKDEITAIRKTGDHVLTARDFQLIMRQINDNLTVQEDKNLFDQSFEDVHAPFLKKLKADFPSLSPADLQLAAYIRMNLASKEIAPLFNISLRGLENKRYRLRKKLGLSNDDSLSDFFLTHE
ncbi:MAG: hypothetical protein LW630_08835 [Saprospiraceae bacterium]|nr:hypothetical protein [Saprospiraceae bacterium]